MFLKHLILPLLAAFVSSGMSGAPTFTRDTCAALDCRVYHLSNGIKVMAKQTVFKPRSVVVRGWSPGGLSMQYSPATAPALLLMEDFTGALGCDGYTADQLRQLSKDEKIRTSVKIDKAEEVLELSVPTSQLGKGMELLCRRAMAPALSPEAFEVWRQRRLQTARRQHTAAVQIMGDSILRNVYDHHPLAGKATQADVEGLTLETMMALVNDRFGDMGDFTFYVSGDFQWPELEKVITTCLGALPAGERARHPEEPHATGFGYPSLSKEIHFKAATHNPLAVAYRFSHGPMPLTVRNHAVANILGQIVMSRLNSTLKDSLGMASFIQGHCSVIYPENGSDSTTFLFPVYVRTTPDHLGQVEGYVDAVLREMSTTGPSAGEFARALSQRGDNMAQALADNGYWLEVMAHYDRHGLNFSEVSSVLPTITPEDIRRFAATVVSAPRVTITMNRPALSTD